MKMFSVHVLRTVNMIMTAVEDQNAVQMAADTFAVKLFQVGCEIQLSKSNLPGINYDHDFSTIIST